MPPLHSLTTAHRIEVENVLVKADESLKNIHSVDDYLQVAPFQYAVKLLSRMVQVFRQYVSYHDMCQIVKIDERFLLNESASPSTFHTVALRCSIMTGQGANSIDIEMQKHAWTSCFNSFQNQARAQLEARGYRTQYYSFSLCPLKTPAATEAGVDGHELASDLYLCMRIETLELAAAGDERIYAQADVDVNVVRRNATEVGFPL